MPNNEEKPVEQEQPKEQPTTPEVDPQVVKAMEMGWRPKEEYEGDEASWVSAETFVARQPLFDKIKEQSRTVKNMKQTVDQLMAHNAKVSDAAYKQAVKDLRAKRAEAIREGEIETVTQIEEDLDSMAEDRNAQRQAATPAQPEVSQEFLEWKAQNRWYGDDRVLTHWADSYGQDLLSQGMTPVEVFQEVEKEARKNFPNKFRNPNRDAASAVGNGNTPNKGKSKDPNAEFKATMTRGDLAIMNKFVEQHGMDEAKYIEDLRLISGA